MPCHLEKQAVFLGPDWSTVYAILDDDHGLYRFDTRSRTWKKDSISRIYRGLPAEARGGVIDDQGITWFFYGKFKTIFINAKINLFKQILKYMVIKNINFFPGIQKRLMIFCIRNILMQLRILIKKFTFLK